MLTDPISDMLTRIRNAVAIERPYVDIPASKVKRGLADVLKREGYVWDWKEVADATMPHLRIVPTGGVDLTTLGDFIRAGCVALGVGSSLVSAKILAEANWQELTRLAGAFVQAIREARGPRL